MTSVFQRPVSSQALLAIIKRLWKSWREQANGLVPKRIRSLFLERPNAILVLSDAKPRALARLFVGDKLVGQSSKPVWSAESIDIFANAYGFARGAFDLALEIAPDRCYFRAFEIPQAAEKAAERIALAEIQKKTAFDLHEIVHAWKIAARGEKLTLAQMALARSALSDAAKQMGLSVELADSILVRHPEFGDFEARLRAAKTGAQAPIARIRRLAYAAVVSFAAAFVILLAKQQIELNRLASQISEAQDKVRVVRRKTERLVRRRNAVQSAIRRKAHRIALLQAWEEVARLLPNDSWLDEFRIAEDRTGKRVATLSGYSKSAAGLVQVFGHSTIFSDASLAGPITPDPRRRRERFILQASLKHVAGATPAQ